MSSPQPLRLNRLLAALANEDYAALVSSLEPVTLNPGATLIEAHSTIEHVYFPESGIASMIANTHDGRIEIGMIGREGLVGLPAVLGTDRTPFSYMVQGTGKAHRIATLALRAVIAERPAILRALCLYAVAMSVQTAQTTYAYASFDIKARLARRILMTQDRADGETLLLTHEFLSTMLGSRRPSVTVAMQMLEGVGAIRAKRGRITVLDRDKLRDLAGDSYQVAEDEYERLMAEVQPGLTPTPSGNQVSDFDY
ncbi:Crp/Fnr family transcriptional regulator [Methylobacterium fujisawaense]|uniref:Crp/Fnr family transcriptional regulator n=1 Tax=Methylobacterium fujisawaense TaxID=107400 RepID=UPI00313BDF83